MSITFGREICGEVAIAQQREWLVTNGSGGYASGTVAGLNTRGYHGVLVAALQPPLGRTVLVSQVDETLNSGERNFNLATTRWRDGTVHPQGFLHLETFALVGTLPRWVYALDEIRLEKQIWMPQGENTTFVQYRLLGGNGPVTLTIKILANYRDYHGRTAGNHWQMDIQPLAQGVQVQAFAGAEPFYIFSPTGTVNPAHDWYQGTALAAERERGLYELDDVLHAATVTLTLPPGASGCLVVSTQAQPSLDAVSSLAQYKQHQQNILQDWQKVCPQKPAPDWITQLVLAADSFIVARPLPDAPTGKTVIAGYHWFGDWGRDTMISLPGLTLSTGRPAIARSILSTFARYIDRGMLPNRFPDQGNPLTEADYNTVDATLWYVEAVRQYFVITQDRELLSQLFPVLKDILDWHRRGTRFGIHLDTSDGLLYSGAPGVQLTWMDAKIGDWVVTPRTGKAVEINALWYCALQTMAELALELGHSGEEYRHQAAVTHQGFERFWCGAKNYCFDVLDTPNGNDHSLRPNQLFAISVPGLRPIPPLLTPAQQQQVVHTCERYLLTSYGLRSLAVGHPDYQGQYSGDSHHRDAVYHQGTVWGWLLGSFALAHYSTFGDAVAAKALLNPIAQHLHNAGLGTISEIFDGDAPHRPQGCISQAWSVAEVLRAWRILAEAELSG
ncbi:glycogen debranching protein [Gloeomargarita lithophora Alchichica-D10]|uniref:Glycogen debranching protein n=1 Tax=Gloeomargarita lithophora Alchichica-D10 TaxID=1188229 RepID=A0A1J0AA43_9CYAN|nr:amylo-alpha-1,6-glucosidase [Gloeomargarita lithophora]APB32812.1 glycogen debranching protein [Gloeomargarita lithophora Alchichica-D10]